MNHNHYNGRATLKKSINIISEQKYPLKKDNFFKFKNFVYSLNIKRVGVY